MPPDASQSVLAFWLVPTAADTAADGAQLDPAVPAEVGRHVAALIGKHTRAGTVRAVRLLGNRERYLLLVSVDGWLSRSQQDGIEALAAVARVEELGDHVPVVPLPGAGEVVGRDVGVRAVRPPDGAAADAVEKAVRTHLLPLVDAPPSRAGNVMGVALLRAKGTDRHLLLLGVDIGTNVRLRAALEALDAETVVESLGEFAEQQLP